MAKVTETTTPQVKPPRTFTVELSETEMAALIVTLGKVSGHDLKTWAKEISDVSEPFLWEKTRPAAILINDVYVAPGPNYVLFDELTEVFND